MNQPDPQLPLSCPQCGAPLRYICTKLSPNTWYLYVCEKHGMFEVPKDTGGAGMRHTPTGTDQQDCDD
jgi:hypothetical protein